MIFASSNSFCWCLKANNGSHKQHAFIYLEIWPAEARGNESSFSALPCFVLTNLSMYKRMMKGKVILITASFTGRAQQSTQGLVFVLLLLFLSVDTWHRKRLMYFMGCRLYFGLLLQHSFRVYKNFKQHRWTIIWYKMCSRVQRSLQKASRACRGQLKPQEFFSSPPPPPHPLSAWKAFAVVMRQQWNLSVLHHNHLPMFALLENKSICDSQCNVVRL